MNYRVINMASVGNAPDFDEENTNEEAIERYLKYLKIDVYKRQATERAWRLNTNGIS